MQSWSHAENCKSYYPAWVMTTTFFQTFYFLPQTSAEVLTSSVNPLPCAWMTLTQGLVLLSNLQWGSLKDITNKHPVLLNSRLSNSLFLLQFLWQKLMILEQGKEKKTPVEIQLQNSFWCRVQMKRENTERQFGSV